MKSHHGYFDSMTEPTRVIIFILKTQLSVTIGQLCLCGDLKKARYFNRNRGRQVSGREKLSSSQPRSNPP